jgi:hypothetical protein
MFLHLGPAPAGMRTRELAQQQAVIEIFRRLDEPRLQEALRAEARVQPAAPAAGAAAVATVAAAGAARRASRIVALAAHRHMQQVPAQQARQAHEWPGVTLASRVDNPAVRA